MTVPHGGRTVSVSCSQGVLEQALEPVVVHSPAKEHKVGGNILGGKLSPAEVLLVIDIGHWRDRAGGFVFHDAALLSVPGVQVHDNVEYMRLKYKLGVIIQCLR